VNITQQLTVLHVEIWQNLDKHKMDMRTDNDLARDRFGRRRSATTLWSQKLFVCLFAWGLTALSAQICYIAP